MCEGLHVLHRNGLVHGDISPRNMIVSGSDLVLTDYDFVGKIGEPLAAAGTVLERRLRDLGVLVGVNDAEAMKRLRPRFEPTTEDEHELD